MTMAATVALLLVLAVVAGIVGARRRGRAWRSAAIVLQPVSALAFYLLLLPPAVPVAAGTLTVLTPGAAQGAVPWLRPVVALPGATAPATVERAPDLATALRRHPQTRALAIAGDGLPPRDLDAVGRLSLRFAPVPDRGLLELSLPPTVALGTQWPLRGRVAAGIAQVELHDPSGAIVDSVHPDADGRFALTALARAPGPSRFELRLLDARQTLIDSAAVPVVVRTGEPLRVIVRAGAPDPEFKYWRRWAADAGIALKLRAGLSEHIDLRDGDTALTAAALQQTDLVILDERSWTTLDAGEKAALVDAVRNGLGLLLRIDGAVDAAVAADWAALGVTLRAAEVQGVTLDRRTGLRDRSAFTAAPVAVQLDGGIALLQADDGSVLAQWRSEGRGRVATWQLLDSYRLQLLGEPGRYGALWSQLLTTLARPQPAPRALQVPPAGWVDERVPLCGLGAAAALVAPDGTRSGLRIGANHCAAAWPAQPGWYHAESDGLSSAFYVRAADDARSLRAARDRRETLRRQAANPAGEGDDPVVRTALPRWPFFGLWLLVTALLWWRERPGTA